MTQKTASEKKLALGPVSSEDAEFIRKWHNLDLIPYRTPYFYTAEMQHEFYKNVVCNRNANSRYFILTDDNPNSVMPNLYAFLGLTNISLENRNAELTIVVSPISRRRGYGRAGLRLLLEHAFTVMNLDNVYGECYMCSESYQWWVKILSSLDMTYAYLSNRKYYNNQYWDSIYFNFTRGNYDNL